MPVFGDHLVAEAFVEPLVSGELAAYAHPHLTAVLDAGIIMDPGHQRRSNAQPLPSWFDSHPPHVQAARFAIEPQATDRVPLEEGKGPAGSSQVVADRLLGFANRAARRIEPAVSTKCRLGQSVDLRRVGRPAETNVKPYQFDSKSIKPLRRARRSAQLKTRWATIRVAMVVRSSRNMTSAPDNAGNMRIAFEPSRLRRITSIQ